MGVRTDGKTVYDLRLGEVVLTTYHDTSTAATTCCRSKHQQVSLTTTPQNAERCWGCGSVQGPRHREEGPNIPDPVAKYRPVAIDDSVAATTGIGGT